MFENDINDLLAILKEQFKPLFEHVYFRHSYELNGIDDSKPYQIYLSFQNDKDTIIVDPVSYTHLTLPTSDLV